MTRGRVARRLPLSCGYTTVGATPARVNEVAPHGVAPYHRAGSNFTPNQPMLELSREGVPTNPNLR